MCACVCSQYVRLTDASTIFGQQFKHLEFFRYFWVRALAGGRAGADVCCARVRTRTHAFSDTCCAPRAQVYNVFPFTILGFWVLSFFYFLLCPVRVRWCGCGGPVIAAPPRSHTRTLSSLSSPRSPTATT